MGKYEDEAHDDANGEEDGGEGEEEHGTEEATRGGGPRITKHEGARLAM